MKTSAGVQPLAFTGAKQWQSWLAKNHETSNDAWLLIGKKGSTRPSLRISDALDVALCYGWIDSQRKGFDSDFYLQRYSSRTSKSPWSKLNVERVAALTAAGRMRKAGLAQVQAAQGDGRWAAAYESQRAATVPPDLTEALKKSARASAAFGQLDKTGQYAVVLPLLKATTPAIRARRLLKAIAKLEELSP